MSKRKTEHVFLGTRLYSAGGCNPQFKIAVSDITGSLNYTLPQSGQKIPCLSLAANRLSLCQVDHEVRDLR
jgi:hypothetical protein